MPVLEIDLSKIKQNTANIKKSLKGIELVGVTKGCQGDERIAKAMVAGGAQILADSRIVNFRDIKNLPIKKMLLRVPFNDEPGHLLRYMDLVMVSNLNDIDKLKRIYRGLGKIGLILNIETGFGREGINPRQCKQALTKTNKLKSSYYLAGFATNTACGALPKQNAKAGQNGSNPLNQLNYFVDLVHSLYSPLPTSHSPLIVSGGNSSVLPWALVQKIPEKINQLRIGEGILLGHDTVNYEQVASNYTDAFKLKVEVAHFCNDNRRDKAILAIGFQDIGAGKLQALGGKIKRIAHVYSDYLTVDLKPNAGSSDWFWFKPDYYALLALMGSPYVKKRYLCYH